MGRMAKTTANATRTVPLDAAFIQRNGKATSSTASSSSMQPAVTWMGHATTLVPVNCLKLIGPIFSELASSMQSFGTKRAQPSGLSLVQLPPINEGMTLRNPCDHLGTNTALARALRERGPPPNALTVMTIAKTRVLPAYPAP